MSHPLYPTIRAIKCLVGKCCFNGSLFAKCFIKGSSKPIFTNFIHKDVVSCRIYCAYRSTPSVSEGYKSSIHMTRVSLKTGCADLTTNTTLFKDLQCEDPRVLCCGETVLMTFSNVITRIPIHIEIHGVHLDANLDLVEDMPTINFSLNKLARTQKNWTFFKELDIVHIIYNIMPFEVYLWNDVDDCILLQSRSWQHPMKAKLHLRGGTPPIKVDGFYYAFVHSTDYEVYCITFHPSTFEVMRVSKDPILKNRGKKKDIHFPCGTIWNACESKFYVSLGVDDINLCFFSIDKSYLDEQLIDVIDAGSVRTQIEKTFSDDFVWINSWGGCADYNLVNFLKPQKVLCKNQVWDTVGCHFPYYVPARAKKIYIIQQPLLSIMKMFMTRTQECNLCKLSSQLHAPFSLTSLIYFMSKQYDDWVDCDKWCERGDVLVTQFTCKTDLTNICEWLDIECVDYDIPFATGPKVSEIDIESLRQRIAREGRIGIALLERLESKISKRFPDCI